MKVRRAKDFLALALLMAAGVIVYPGSAQAQTSAQKKSSASSTSKTSKPSYSATRKKSSKKAKARDRGQKAPEPERINAIQQALAKDGSFTGTPNGKWDDSTVAATKKFQEAHGLNPTGKLDAKTLQQLGLGSSTAGVAPPMPPVSSSSLQTSPTPEAARRQQ
jgi:peptidoglycan hydrolase-like protein with peptidoglycan-binding domain